MFNSDTFQFRLRKVSILTLSYSKAFQFWHFPFFTLSNYDAFQFFFHKGLNRIRTLSNSDTIQALACLLFCNIERRAHLFFSGHDGMLKLLEPNNTPPFVTIRLVLLTDCDIKSVIESFPSGPLCFCPTIHMLTVYANSFFPFSYC